MGKAWARLKGYAPRHWLLVAFGAAALALVVAYVAEFVFGLRPCEMCYWQRGPFAFVVVVALLGWFIPRGRRFALWLSLAAFVLSIGLAVFHAGVEWRWWEGPGACSSGIGPGMSVEEIMRAVAAAPSVSCLDPAIRVLGLSMAGWNALYSLACAALLALGLFYTRRKP